MSNYFDERNADSAPFVSIIMPTYNRARLIKQTIQSVRAQTFTNWELIIVDDGSGDNTEEIVAGVDDKRIFFVNAGRIGINGRVKNLGISRARGKLIAFIDSDDLWSPGKLEKQIAALTQYPGAGFSLTGGYNFRDENIPESYFYKEREGCRYGNLFQAMFKSEVATLTPTLLLQRKCLAVTGGFPEKNPFSDGDFILQLARHFNGIVLYEPLFYRRLHDENDSNANWVARCHEGIERVMAYKREKILPARLAADALFRMNVHLGEKYIRHGKYWQAIAKFYRAWRYKPLSIVPFKKTAKTVLFALKK